MCTFCINCQSIYVYFSGPCVEIPNANIPPKMKKTCKTTSSCTLAQSCTSARNALIMPKRIQLLRGKT